MGYSGKNEQDFRNIWTIEALMNPGLHKVQIMSQM